MRRAGRRYAPSWATLQSGTIAVALLMTAGPARADVASDAAAAILVFPKLVVDTSSPPVTPRGRIDTLVRISNTSTQPVSMRCFYVDATPQCSNGSGSCLSNPVSCTGLCQSQWQETDFVVNITAQQPIAWLVSQGEIECTPTSPPNIPCFPLTSSGRPGPNGQNNSGSRVPPAPEDPFIGYLKCVEVDRNDVPVDHNDLKGEAEITRVHDGTPDVEGYNAIGIPAIPGANNSIAPGAADPTHTLVLGGNMCAGGSNAQAPCAGPADCPGGTCVSVGEYAGCPNVLILDHFFDGADDPVSGARITTDLTLVPCSEDFLTQTPVVTPVQFLVFNEFEQRFSTSRIVTCFQELTLSRIDTPSPDKSIFSAAVNGTLTGQTRIQGVDCRRANSPVLCQDQQSLYGHALLGIAEEFRDGGGTAGFNLHFNGTRPQSDFIYLP